MESHGQSSVSALADLLDPASGNTPLMYAAMENKISLLEKMIWLGSPLHLTNKAKAVNHVAFDFHRDTCLFFFRKVTVSCIWHAFMLNPTWFPSF